MAASFENGYLSLRNGGDSSDLQRYILLTSSSEPNLSDLRTLIPEIFSREGARKALLMLEIFCQPYLNSHSHRTVT
jgi:hypothetical protein